MTEEGGGACGLAWDESDLFRQCDILLPSRSLKEEIYSGALSGGCGSVFICTVLAI